jgi:hypothetical protein
MTSEDEQIGMLVKVSKGHRKPNMRGRIGVRQRYGVVSYAAFEVMFGKKESDLFWHHELEEAEELYQQCG